MVDTGSRLPWCQCHVVLYNDADGFFQGGEKQGMETIGFRDDSIIFRLILIMMRDPIPGEFIVCTVYEPVTVRAVPEAANIVYPQS